MINQHNDVMENKRLEQLIIKYSSYDHKIYDNTSIVRDLDIKNEHAKAFIEEFAEAFGVDISNFNSSKYFSFDDNKSSTANTLTELTVADLQRAIFTGELDDDIISFDENDLNLPPQFTAKNIILGILLVIIVSTLLGFVAIFL